MAGQEFMAATKRKNAVAQRKALDRCKAQAGFPTELLESIAALVMPSNNKICSSSSSLQLAQDALKAALLARLKYLTPESVPSMAQVRIFLMHAAALLAHTRLTCALRKSIITTQVYRIMWQQSHPST